MPAINICVISVIDRSLGHVDGSIRATEQRLFSCLMQGLKSLSDTLWQSSDRAILFVVILYLQDKF